MEAAMHAAIAAIGLSLGVSSYETDRIWEQMSGKSALPYPSGVFADFVTAARELGIEVPDRPGWTS